MKRIFTLLGLAAVAFYCSTAVAGEGGKKLEAKEGAAAEAGCCGSHGLLHKVFHRGCCKKLSLEIPLPSITLPSLPCFRVDACCGNPLTHMIDKIKSLRPCCMPKLSLPCGHCGLSGLRCKLHGLFRRGCSSCGDAGEKAEPAPAPAPAPAPKPAAPAKPDNARRDGLLILTPAG